MSDSLFSPIHPSWSPIIDPLSGSILQSYQAISSGEFIPAIDRIFAPLSIPFDEVKVVIVGQDPYPNPENADGFAFSVRPDVSPLPPSLVNIFKELESDCGTSMPSNGNLERWSDQGVLLINRTLTTTPGQSHAHQRAGWLQITEEIISAVARNGAIGILWGGNAHQLSGYFENDKVIMSAHPSPLSAYRGFFGSKPFSRVNQILVDQGKQPIIW